MAKKFEENQGTPTIGHEVIEIEGEAPGVSPSDAWGGPIQPTSPVSLTQGGGSGSPKPPPSPKRGQDLKGEKCFRKEAGGSETLGRCEKVCKDLDILGKDRVRNRWFCKSPPPPKPDDDDLIAHAVEGAWKKTV